VAILVLIAVMSAATIVALSLFSVMLLIFKKILLVN
jgi:hypothetical protein